MIEFIHSVIAFNGQVDFFSILGGPGRELRCSTN